MWYKEVFIHFKRKSLGSLLRFWCEYIDAGALHTQSNGYGPQTCWLLYEWSLSVWTISLSHTDTERYSRHKPSDDRVQVYWFGISDTHYIVWITWWVKTPRPAALIFITYISQSFKSNCVGKYCIWGYEETLGLVHKYIPKNFRKLFLKASFKRYKIL